jgi:threonine/homoserine/homoserine lactone efflux protein
MLKALIITLNRRGPSMEYYAALGGVLLLLGIALITPGPNALTCFAHGGMFGPRSNIPLIGGMVIGFVTIEMSVGLLVNSLNDSPTALTVLHWIGMVFLALMALGMFRVNPSSINTEGVESMLGVKVGICMQFVNGKEWAFVIILMSNYIEPLGGGLQGILTILAITLSVCVSAMIGWTMLGAHLSNFFSHETRGMRVFQICGVLLALLWVGLLLQGPSQLE